MRLHTTLITSLSLAGALCAASCGNAAAQAPVANPMPDGSQDRYLGLGLRSAPNYDGGSHNRVRLLPVLQLEWSNGIFVSGPMMGMHWSRRQDMEYGPLLSLHGGRSERGGGLFTLGLSGIDNTTIAPIGSGPFVSGSFAPGPVAPAAPLTRLSGMPTVHQRLEAGGFATYYLAPQWRATGNLLYGAGNGRDGLRATLDLQRVAAEVAPHHTLSFTAGLTLANRRYNHALFGVTAVQAQFPYSLVRHAYDPGGGIKDVHAGLRWNWSLTPVWIVASGAQAARLTGGAKDSPLVERATSMSVWSALAYRF